MSHRPGFSPPPGAGLGFRRAFQDELTGALLTNAPDFLEIAPENWMGMGGRYAATLQTLAERFPLICHGLSLNIGGQAPLDMPFLKALKRFLDQYSIQVYSEHLSFSGDDGHLYDLLPIPFVEEAVDHVAVRIRTVQDILERRLILENVSYYAAPGATMSESDFLNRVLKEGDCDLLLDVNNIYVNSINHGYDPSGFLEAMPTERIAYLHVAGHLRESDELLIDTHGESVTDPVWRLLAEAYVRHGVKPTLLERDFNIPPLGELLAEVDAIRTLQALGGKSS